MPFLQLIIAIILSFLLYLLFPFVYFKIKGKVSEKRGKKIALLNSIICEGISVMLAILIGAEPETNGTMFVQGFFYYFIAKGILIDYNMSEKDSKNEASKDALEKHEDAISLLFQDNNQTSINATEISQEVILDATNNLELAEANAANMNKYVKLSQERQLRFQVNKLRQYEQNLLIVLFLFIITTIVFSGAILISHSKKLNSENYQEVTLKSINKNEKTYMQEMKVNDVTHYVIYQKVNGKLESYVFTKSNYSQIKGRANKTDILNYFTNLTESKPPIVFTCTGIFVFTIILVIVELVIGLTFVLLFKNGVSKIYSFLLRVSYKSDLIQEIQKNQHDIDNILITDRQFKETKQKVMQEIVGNKYKKLL